MNENAGVKFYARFFMSKYLIYVPKKITFKTVAIDTELIRNISYNRTIR